MNSHSDNQVDIRHLQRLFDNKSESYKLFWFKAIVEYASKGQKIISYGQLIDKMIAYAWYMVSEYKLNLGPKDTLERIVKRLYTTSGLQSSEKENVILKYLESEQDKEIVEFKRTLTLNVPYRLQSPFLTDFKTNTWKQRTPILVDRINEHKNLIYRIIKLNGLNSLIEIDDKWMEYFINNQEIISGWIEFNLIDYLQRRNPNIPGIPSKIKPPEIRKLENVKKYYISLLEVKDIKDIYTDDILVKNDISIDHFIPWSYVAHDEFWNLTPTTNSINSSKSNNLPNYNKYIDKLCIQEFDNYKTALKFEAIRNHLMNCFKNNMNDDEILYQLFNENIEITEFSNCLKGIIEPVYKSAMNAGFDEWDK